MILRAKYTVAFAPLVLLSALNAHAASEKGKDLAGNYQWHDHLDMGAGYEFYRQDIDSADESFPGTTASNTTDHLCMRGPEFCACHSR